MSDRQVIVIGGGLAGIAASLECAQAGAAVTLLESRGRLGGAAYSFTRDGIYADNGQHVFLRCCTAYRQLLERIGADGLVTLQDRLEIPVLAPGRRPARLGRSALPAPLHLAGSLARYPLLRMRDRVSVAFAMRALGKLNLDDPALDSRTFGEWLTDHGQSRSAVEAIWDLIVRPTVNLDPSEASLAQVAQVFQVGLLSDRSAGDIGYSRGPLSDIHDRAAGAALERAGVDVRLRSGVTGVIPGHGGFRVERNGAPTLGADVVVLAVQPDRLARLVPEAAGVDRTALAGLGSSPIVNLHFVFDRPVTELPLAAGVQTPVQWLFDRSAGAGLEHGQYLAISLSAADDELGMTSDDLRSRYQDALAELLPEVGGAKLDCFFVTREHAATFRAAPGARKLRLGPRTALPGLVLAGSWTDTGWPATMEGAVRSGQAAAHEALMALSRGSRGSQRLQEPALVPDGHNGNGASAPDGAAAHDGVLASNGARVSNGAAAPDGAAAANGKPGAHPSEGALIAGSS